MWNDFEQFVTCEMRMHVTLVFGDFLFKCPGLMTQDNVFLDTSKHAIWCSHNYTILAFNFLNLLLDESFKITILTKDNLSLTLDNILI